MGVPWTIKKKLKENNIDKMSKTRIAKQNNNMKPIFSCLTGSYVLEMECHNTKIK